MPGPLRRASGLVGGCPVWLEVVSGVGGGEVGFEELYAKAGADLQVVPWASLSAHPGLVSWLDRQPVSCGESALVVGCGYGADAEELDRRGYRAIAFDIAPTAIARCHERFPSSKVGPSAAPACMPTRYSATFADDT